jgi:hypothetical protein
MKTKEAPSFEGKENYALNTKLRFLTEEGHTRARNTFQRIRLFAVLMFLVAGACGYVIHSYWVQPNLTPLQRVYLRQYLRSTVKSYRTSSRSRYTYMLGTVSDPITGRDVRSMVPDSFVDPVLDPDGRIKVEQQYPAFRLHSDVDLKEFFWANEFIADKRAAKCVTFRCLQSSPTNCGDSCLRPVTTFCISPEITTSGSFLRRRTLRASGNAWKEVLRIYSKEPGSKTSVSMIFVTRLHRGT